MVDKKVRLVLLVCSVILTIPSGVRATQCITEYSWTCPETSTTCEGTVSPGAETYTETLSSPHRLRQVVRFAGLPHGTHKLRLAEAVGHVNGGEDSIESINFNSRQAAGCTESGFYQGVVICDPTSCQEVADYNLPSSGDDDICIEVISARDDNEQDEFTVSHGTGEGDLRPVIVTTIPDVVGVAESDYITNPGLVDGGDYTDTLSSNNVYETLLEGGSQHRLFHVWRFTGIPTGSSHTLHIEGNRPSNSDGDDFRISYKWSSTCTGTFLVTGLTINSTSDAALSTTIGAGSDSGTLCIGVSDSFGGSINDSVNIDHLYVVTADPPCPEE